MAYFQELPNLQYISRFPDQSSNRDTVLGKNIYRRGKLREDILSVITAFNDYSIKEGERPDQLAERFYNDPELDWVLLIVNNIIDFYSEWPISNRNFYDYLIEKYGSEEELEKILYYETEEVLDEFNRRIIPQGIRVDPDKYQTFVANDEELEYELDEYPIPSTLYPLLITTTLSSFIEGWERDNLGPNEPYTGEEYVVNNILLQQPQGEGFEDPLTGLFYAPPIRDYATLPVYTREGVPVPVDSPITLSGWPSTWGAYTPIYARNLNTYEVYHKSTLGRKTDITEDFRLYVISEKEDETGKLIPLFKFTTIE